MHCDPTQRWSSIDQWRHGIIQHESPRDAAAAASYHLGPPIRHGGGDGNSKNKRKRGAGSPAAFPVIMSTPPSSRSASVSRRREGSSPSKKRKVFPDHDGVRAAADVFVTEEEEEDADQTTPRRRRSVLSHHMPLRLPYPRQTMTTTGTITTSQMAIATGGTRSEQPSLVGGFPTTTATPSIASSSRTSTTTTSRTSRSVSPTKKTQNLVALRKPIHHVALDGNATDQLPHDVRALYNRLYDITVDHEAFLPWEAREDIRRAMGRRVKDSWFQRKRGNGEEGDDSSRGAAAEDTQTTTTGERVEERAAALAELDALRRLEHAAKECRRLGRSEAAWNAEVHGPLLELGLARHGHARKELVTTAQIAKPFLPPMDTYSAAEYVDKKMVDYVLVLDPEDARPQRHGGAQQPVGGGGGKDFSAAGEEEEEDDEGAVGYQRLAQAIKEQIYSQPPACRSINQTIYTPLLFRPIGVSIETKADGASEEGRIQLAIWSAAWHQRMGSFLEKRRGRRRGADDDGGEHHQSRVITLPALLIVEHMWVLSFVCDRGDRLEIIGEMALGDTRSLLGLYTLLAVVRELGDWIEGPFRSWISDLLLL